MVESAAIYARISDDREGRALGVHRQLDDCRALADRRSWPIMREYVDNDISAYTGKSRTEYHQMLTAVKDREIDAIVVYHLDRLHRQPRELEDFFETCDAVGLTALASVTGDVDLGTHDGRFTARILGAVARKESDDKSRRIRRKALELAQEGRASGGGTRPFGYEIDRLTLRADEAVVIQALAQRFLAGESLRSLTNWLNEEVPTVTGSAPWHINTVRRLLYSARISGQREHRGQIVGTAQWPAIVAPEQTNRIRAILDDPSRRTSRTTRRYLLTGLLLCQRCGARMVAGRKDDGQRRYICATHASGCGHTYVLADPVEDLVARAVLHRLDTPELLAALEGRASADEESSFLQDQIADDQTQLNELADAYSNRQISMPEWLRARGSIERRLEDAKRRLSRLTNVSPVHDFVGQSDSLRRQWATLPLSRQQAIVRTLLDHAVVGPGVRGVNRFDPSRITPTWRL